MRDVVIAFSLLIFCVLILFRLVSISQLRPGFTTEYWIAGFSLVFMVLGIIITRKVSGSAKKPEGASQDPLTSQDGSPPISPSPEVIETESDHHPNDSGLKQSGLSKRELEILILINDGLSNQQIADRLYVSSHTVKKHLSNIYGKLDAERRTDAINKAKQLRIIE